MGPSLRYLGLDVGDERIGVALSDESGQVARPLVTLARSAGPSSFLRIAALVQEHQVRGIVIGLPLLPGGAEGKQVASVRAYLAGLRKYVSVPCIEMDERDSTNRAREALAQSGRGQRRRARMEDAVAAAIILQDFIAQQEGSL